MIIPFFTDCICRYYTTFTGKMQAESTINHPQKKETGRIQGSGMRQTNALDGLTKKSGT